MISRFLFPWTPPLWTGEQQWVQLRDSGRCCLVAVECTWGYSSGWGFFVPNLLCAKDQANENWAQVRHLADFPTGYEGDPSAHFPHCFFLPSFSSSLHLCHCLQSIGQVIIFSFLKVVLETIYLRSGLKPTWQGPCAVLCHSVVSDWDLSLAKTYGAWF